MEHIPYSKQAITPEDVDAVIEVLTSDFLTQGPAIPRFEEAMAAAHGAAHGVAVCNATGALHIACLALGVGPGDLVWTVPNTFVASANCARYCGADIDFVDINPATRNISIDELSAKLSQAEMNGRLPKVVIPVDFSGLPSDLPAIRELADKYGFSILEDASHAVGASIGGARIGSNWADITVLSFHPVKIITTGEGGMCLTRDSDLAETLRLLRSHGITRDGRRMLRQDEGDFYYEQVMLGFNYRLTDIQAALGLSQFYRHAQRHEKRNALAERYDALLNDLPLKVPARPPGFTSSHHLYVVEIDDPKVSRQSLFKHLRSNGIGANVHYIPVHLQPDFMKLGFKRGDFPASEHYYDRAITIPLYPEMTHSQQDRVVEVLRSGLLR